MEDRHYAIGIVPGDGSGPELMESALTVLRALADAVQRDGSQPEIELVQADIGYDRWVRTHDAIERDGITWAGIDSDDLNNLSRCDVILFTAVGTADFSPDVMTPYPLLRKELDVFANVRRGRAFPNCAVLGSDFDVTLVREQSEGLWMAPEFTIGEVGCAVARASKRGSERIARFAFEEARRLNAPSVTCVHKANISRQFFGQFRQAFRDMAVDYPDVKLVEMHTDVLPLELIRNPSVLHVVATTNMYGDAISGELAGLVGGLGMLPSAEYGSKGAIFRPAHGTAPDIAGKGLVNPTATLLALQMMLGWLGAEHQDETLLAMSRQLHDSLTQVYVDGLVLTRDVGGDSTTAEMTSAVVACIRRNAREK